MGHGAWGKRLRARCIGKENGTRGMGQEAVVKKRQQSEFQQRERMTKALATSRWPAGGDRRCGNDGDGAPRS